MERIYYYSESGRKTEELLFENRRLVSSERYIYHPAGHLVEVHTYEVEADGYGEEVLVGKQFYTYY